MLRRRLLRSCASSPSWNEANYCGEKTCHRPGSSPPTTARSSSRARAARYLAAELLDEPGMTAWVKAFIHKAKLQPKYWGLHNYLDANYLRTSGTRALLRATKGEIWFTETGGIVKRRNCPGCGSPTSRSMRRPRRAGCSTSSSPSTAAGSPTSTCFHWNPATAHDYVGLGPREPARQAAPGLPRAEACSWRAQACTPALAGRLERGVSRPAAPERVQRDLDRGHVVGRAQVLGRIVRAPVLQRDVRDRVAVGARKPDVYGVTTSS